MKYGGRAVFRGLGMSTGMIGKTAYRKILKNIGKEVSFRITPATRLSGKTVKGDIFASKITIEPRLSQSNFKMVFTDSW